MKRNFLEDLGLEKRNKLQGKIDDLVTQAEQRDKDLEKIQNKLDAVKDDSTKLKDAQSALEELQSKYAADKSEWEAKNARQAYEYAIKERANALKFSSAAAKRDFIREAIGKEFKMEQDSILGFDDYVELYKKSDPGAFVEDKPKDPEPAEPTPTITIPGNSNVAGNGKSLSELMKAKNQNPDMKVTFNTGK